MVSLSGIASSINLGALFSNIMIGLIFIVVTGAVAVWLFFYFRNKSTFKTPISVILLSENGVHKRRDDIKGGMMKQKHGVMDFVLKVPKQMKKKKLGYVPDFSKADGNGRLVFISVGDGMVLQQCVEKLITEKETTMEIEKEGKKETITVPYSLIVEPIPTDIKTITINNLHSVENLMDSQRFKAATIAIGAFVLMVFVQIIFLFLTSK